jgi:pteridine reductase
MPMTASEHPVVLVTGAARRVGAVIARSLHAAGFDIALHYRDSADDAERLAAEFESRRERSVLRLQADLADTDALPALVRRTVQHFGRLDGLVNNASGFWRTPFRELTVADFDRLMAVNARAPLFLARAAAPHLRAAGGAIVNIGDIFGERPLGDFLPYSMSKAALLMLTRGLAKELGPEVRVNAVLPGTVLASELEEKAESAAEIKARTTLKRVGTPEEVADAVRWLLTGASYVSGQCIRVDGGRSVGF